MGARTVVINYHCSIINGAKLSENFSKICWSLNLIYIPIEQKSHPTLLKTIFSGGIPKFKANNRILSECSWETFAQK